MPSAPARRAARVLLPLLATLLLAPAGAQAGTASGTAKNITVPAAGLANPYPSDIVISGATGRISSIKVELQQLKHTFPDDLDILLEGPAGNAVILMSDVCGGSPGLTDPRFFRFETGATQTMPDEGPCPSDTYAPSGSVDGTDDWPGFSGTKTTSLADFARQDPNGTWRLRVVDDSNVDQGEILQWALTITTAAATFPPNGSDGEATPYPVKFSPTIPGPGVVRDVNVTLPGISHSGPDQIDALLQAPTGQSVLLMSGACGAGTLLNQTFTFDDEASGPPTFQCPTTTFRPGTGPSLVTLRLTFPIPPFTTTLSSFDLLDPRGEWKLFLADRSGSSATSFVEGLANPPQLTFTMQATPLSLGGATAAATEGGSVALDITRTDPGPYGAGAIRLKTADASATAGTDYTAIDQIVTFAAGETTKRVTVPVTADGATGEDAETFTATLSAPTGDASVGATATTTVTIGADPVPPPASTGGAGNGGGAAGTGSAESTSGGAGAGGTSGPPAKPVSSVIARLPAATRCVRAGARLTVTPTPPAGVSIASAKAKVNGRTVATKSGSSAVRPFGITARARKGKVRVVVTFTATDGRTFTVRRTYTACKKRR